MQNLDVLFAIDRAGRREIARWVVFLYSEQDYLWPEYSFIQIVDWPLSILTLDWWGKKQRQKWQQYQDAGDFDIINR